MTQIVNTGTIVPARDNDAEMLNTIASGWSNQNPVPCSGGVDAELDQVHRMIAIASDLRASCTCPKRL